MVPGMGRPRGFDEEAVVDQAMETFWTHGYAGTSPADLAAATGVAKGSLYNAFTSKRELFDRALARYDEMARQLAEDYLSRPGSTKECLAASLRFLVDTDLAAPQRRGCLVVNTTVELAGHDPEMSRALRLNQDHIIAALAARIDEGRRAGDVHADVSAQAYAEFLMNTMVGLRVMAKIYDGPTLHRIIDSALATL